MKTFFQIVVVLAVFSSVPSQVAFFCNSAQAAVGETATIEGTVLSFNQKEVVISQRGKIQKIPRSLVPEKIDLKTGMFLTIEIPVKH